jgi:predicted nucleic acid-binding protein
MTYLDTSVLIYSSVIQDKLKYEQSKEYIENLISEESLVLSPLVIQEFMYSLAKLKIANSIIEENFNFFLSFSSGQVDTGILSRARNICIAVDDFKNFNDAVHVALAEKHADKLCSYDKDYMRFKNICSIEIELL